MISKKYMKIHLLLIAIDTMEDNQGGWVEQQGFMYSDLTIWWELD